MNALEPRPPRADATDPARRPAAGRPKTVSALGLALGAGLLLLGRSSRPGARPAIPAAPRAPAPPPTAVPPAAEAEPARLAPAATVVAPDPAVASAPTLAPTLVLPARLSPRDARIALGLGVYLVLCGLVALYAMGDLWAGRFTLPRLLFPGIDLKAHDLAAIQSFGYTALGAVIGAAILSLYGLHQHAAMKADFRSSYLGSYVVGPWASAFLGVAAYALVRGGLLVFGGSGEVDGATPSTQLAYLALGILTGFAFDRVLAKMNDLAEQVFARAAPRPASSQANPAAPGQAQAATPAAAPAKPADPVTP